MPDNKLKPRSSYSDDGINLNFLGVLFYSCLTWLEIERVAGVRETWERLSAEQ